MIQLENPWKRGHLSLKRKGNHWQVGTRVSSGASWECNAVADPSNVGRWYKTIQMEKQKFTVISNAAALEKPGSHHMLFHQIPGVSTKFVRGDALHILFCSGIYSHLLGSVLHHLCWFDGKGKQVKAPAERLSVLWENIQKTYKKLGSATRLSNLRLSMFSDVKQPHKAFPTLSIKGSEAKHLLPAMLIVCKTMLRKDMWHEKCMLDAMACMVKLVELYDNADIFLEEKEWNKAFTLGKGFLDAYSLLNQWAFEFIRDTFGHDNPKEEKLGDAIEVILGLMEIWDSVPQCIPPKLSNQKVINEIRRGVECSLIHFCSIGENKMSSKNRKMTKRKGLSEEVPDEITGIKSELNYCIPEDEGTEDFSPFTELLEEAEEEPEPEEDAEMIYSSEEETEVNPDEPEEAQEQDEPMEGAPEDGPEAKRRKVALMIESIPNTAKDEGVCLACGEIGHTMPVCPREEDVNKISDVFDMILSKFKVP